MRHLSPAYIQDVVSEVFKNVNDERCDGIKNLVLSSPEWTRAFDNVMPDVFVKYNYRRIILDSKHTLFVHLSHKNRQCNWMASFIQKLSIECYLNGEAIRFLKEIFSYNYLRELNLCSMKQLCNDPEALQIVKIASKRNDLLKVNRVVKSLISIIQKLVINTKQMEEIPDYFPRCEVIFFNCKSVYMSTFQQILGNSNSSVALELQFDTSSASVKNCVDVMNKYKEQLHHVRRFDFVLSCDTTPDLEIENLINYMSTFSSSVENVNICISWKPTASNQNRNDFLHFLKNQFEKTIAVLCKTPQHIKANVFCKVKDIFFDFQTVFALLEHHYPKEDFVVKKSYLQRIIVNRQKTVLKNVQFFYEFDAGMHWIDNGDDDGPDDYGYELEW